MAPLPKRSPMIGLGLTTAMAAVLLAGCAANPAPRAQAAAADTELAVAHSQRETALRAAEAAVAAEPRNAAYRLALGDAYLDAGRFAAASTSFEDAMTLGARSPRTALSLVLALTGQARYAEASALLNDWQGEIAAADLGLAYALAGQPERGVHVLTNAIRGGDNTAKTRQNLAYTYAVAGRWRESRMMVAQDVPAHEVGQRMAEWAQMTHAEAYNPRVARLLGVPANVRDNGQPVQLALVNTPSAEQLAAETSALIARPQAAADPLERTDIPQTGGELPPIGTATPRYEQERAAAPTSFAEAFADEAPRAAPAQPMRRAAPATATATAPAPAPAPALAPLDTIAPAATSAAPAMRSASREATRRPAGSITPDIARPALRAAVQPVHSGVPTHLIQLGSFSSEAGAERAWAVYVDRYPELAERAKVITQAVVNGRNYWRISAGGYDTIGSRAMCDRIAAANGDGCISWAASRPLPGAVDASVRLARR